ncbi:MAG: thiamine phosphate synthase [Rhodocyclaceae bacterium]|nr:thiamine phosphate synthase [Rhodocyclaceae bacterium]
MPTDSVRLRGLYAITPSEHSLVQLILQAEAALAGGVRLMQYRNKLANAPLLKQVQATELLRRCHNYGAKLIINDSVILAVEMGADGVHIGRDDPYYTELPQARALLGPNRILGVSCYNDLNRAKTAVEAGADYVAFGSVFASPTKPDACRVSLATLRQARQCFNVPIVAIGGITLENAPEVIHTGVDVLAVSTGLFSAMEDVPIRAEKFQQLFEGGCHP